MVQRSSFWRLSQQAVLQSFKELKHSSLQLHKNTQLWTCYSYSWANLRTMHFFSPWTLRISFFVCLFSKSVPLTPADRFFCSLALPPSPKWPRKDLSYNFHLPWGESVQRSLQAMSCWGCQLNATRHLLPCTWVLHFFIQLNLLLCYTQRCARRNHNLFDLSVPRGTILIFLSLYGIAPVLHVNIPWCKT